MISHAGQTGAHNSRLLPWCNPEGNPCYVIGDGTGYISRVADNVESVQLDMAADLLDHVADLLSDGTATPEQIRFVAARMTESLREVHRIARSRGDRIPRLEQGVPEEQEDGSDVSGG
ncbi:hypothetical protein LHJ74_08485 [Streptomyces sp. N2-109]|uniref:Uncharacterized protein n=1 Tax=Streptomyces gossypii TaxID=2883101 RepID=A0ABT2JPY5_9ACTN|nr:hypothetical protein [Streptomyces gossypii]MCT2589947.1 hypothetical protein [Streptomyces gossypii]